LARLFDMHVHTTRGSSDSNLSPEEMVLEAERLGFMGICITEHSGPWDQHEFRSFAAKHNQVLVRAMEVETNMGHILAFGLDSYQPGISDARVLRKAADSAGGFIISAHPFRGLHSSLPSRKPLLYSNEGEVPTSVEEATLHPVFGLVDAVEVANGGTADAENRFALDVAKELGLRVTGGSDAHSLHGVGHCITVFDGEVNSQEEFMNALRAGSFYPAVLSPNNKSSEGSWVPIPEPFS